MDDKEKIDAARYRWLRDTNHDDALRASGEHMDPMQVSMLWFAHAADKWTLGDFAVAPVGVKFDAAVDAAMAAQKSKHKE